MGNLIAILLVALGIGDCFDILNLGIDELIIEVVNQVICAYRGWC